MDTKLIRLSIDMPKEMHKYLRILSATTDKTIREIIIGLVEEMRAKK